MDEYDPQAKDRLLNLLRLELGKDIAYDDFRREFEDAFNFGLDRAQVSEAEFGVFQKVFDKVIWYSPFVNERKEIPNYIGEIEMEAVVDEARRALGITAKRHCN